MSQERIEFKFEDEKNEKSEASSSINSIIADPKNEALPISCLVIGMAGSGKTTLMQKINSYITEKKLPSYFLNLDPAVLETGFEANIDIRETVNYQNVMKSFNLGPNGGILTALNLFSTKFDQVMGFLEKRTKSTNPDDKLDYIFVDTPGQIEVFTWSSSGTIISESLASAYPTVVLYVIDTPRTTSPITFMSNMLYACSILYKTRLPFILVFNKVDMQPCDFALKWMKDFTIFQNALDSDANEKASYSSSLAYSLSLVLDEFYQNLRTAGVSAVTGEGMDQLFEVINAGRKEYYETYFAEMERKKKYLEKLTKKQQKNDLEKVEKDREEELKKKGKKVLKQEDDDDEEEEEDDDNELRNDDNDEEDDE